VRYPSPDHNRATPKPIPLKNTSVGEAFPTTSVYMTSTVRTKKSEPLQQDNAQPHVARVCQDFLPNHNINPFDWPPYSPVLTPIEHLWDEMDRRVRGRRNAPATLDQLGAALLEE
jgi:hypothetical protein